MYNNRCSMSLPGYQEQCRKPPVGGAEGERGFHL